MLPFLSKQSTCMHGGEGLNMKVMIISIFLSGIPKFIMTPFCFGAFNPTEVNKVFNSTWKDRH